MIRRVYLTNGRSPFHQAGTPFGVNNLEKARVTFKFAITKPEHMRYAFLLFAFAACMTLNGCSQNNPQKQNPASGTDQKVGGGCDGCTAVYDSPVPFDKLNSIDTFPDFNEPGPKMVISGIIYNPDGKTPAKDIVLYAYHTDQTGHYVNKYNEKNPGGRNGYIKGWIKTNEKGEYRFYTLKPAAYPRGNVPAHIHSIIKEPGKTEYWIDEYLFDDDPLLTAAERKKQESRGGNGIITLEERNGMLYGERNIYLGRNIPDYPQTRMKGLQSGLNLGDNCPAFDPLHLSGADKGKHVCPMCKYGYGQGVMLWFNHTNLDKLKRFAVLLDREIKERGVKKLRVFLVYMNPAYKMNDRTGQIILQGKIEKWCIAQNLQQVAMIWVPSPIDEETAGVYKINPKADNTVFVYKKRKIAAKWVNIDYSDEFLEEMLKQL